MAVEFNPWKMEKKWIKKWKENKLFNPVPDKRSKFYLTVAYPYPSGSMHVGHGRTYTVPDVIARFKRMQGHNVLFPMAWHVTGSPVLGIAERIKKKDPKTLKIYGELYKTPPEVLETFTEPENIVKHFSGEYKSNMEGLGYSIDWRREFLTITPQYSKFIEWQYKTLYSKNLITKGEHPVRYCPGCDNPVGDHDLLEGENASINEFTIIKFKLGDMILPAATLRPETVFGVTNMWLNPEIEYVKAQVEDEIWLLSREATEKLSNSGRKVNVIETISGKDILGKTCQNPVDKRDIPILPASFVDPDYATGVVMSVPAHAPYDYVALRDLKDYKIKPIPIITTPKYGKIPSEDIVKELGVKNQSDPKLSEATETLYRAENAKGVLDKSIAEFGGQSVKEAKEKIAKKILEDGFGSIFYEFSETPVICRCGTKCHIRLLKDQWFLKYSDPEWKRKTHKCLEDMQIIPAETEQNFSYFIDWLKDWACTRRVGLGTRMPWDNTWLIEPLSDSTIYMAFYTISHYLKTLDAEKLTPEFFDFILLGKGDLHNIEASTGIPGETIEKIREEFTYWYSPEWRLSAKDLVGNHLTFHMFHHTAIFPKELYPKGIVVFGMGLLEGNKMSSSKGNIIILSDAMKKYGSDTVRLFLMSNAEPWQDFDWRENLLINTSKKVKQFYDLVNHIYSLDNSLQIRDIDRWIISRFEEAVKETTDALEAFQTRKAVQSSFYNILKDIAWYQRRCTPNASVLKELADRWIRLIAPFTPFVCEDLWAEISPGKDFVSTSAYPVSNTEKIDEKAIQKEETIKDLLHDVQHILEVTKATPAKIYLYLAPKWKRKLFGIIKEGGKIPDAMKDPELRVHGKLVANIMNKIRKEEIPQTILNIEDEESCFSDRAR